MESSRFKSQWVKKKKKLSIKNSINKRKLQSSPVCPFPFFYFIFQITKQNTRLQKIRIKLNLQKIKKESARFKRDSQKKKRENRSQKGPIFGEDRRDGENGLQAGTAASPRKRRPQKPGAGQWVWGWETHRLAVWEVREG